MIFLLASGHDNFFNSVSISNHDKNFDDFFNFLIDRSI